MNKHGSARKRHVRVRNRKEWRRKTRQKVAETQAIAENDSTSNDHHTEAGIHPTPVPVPISRFSTRAQTYSPIEDERDVIPVSENYKETPFQGSENLDSNQDSYHPALKLNADTDIRVDQGSDNDDDSEDVHNIFDEDAYDNLHSRSYDQAEQREENGSSGTDETTLTNLEKVMLSDHTLSGLCLIVGSSRLTLKQYRRSRLFLNHEGHYGRRQGYPSYTSIYSTVLPLMRKYVYVPATKYTFDVDSSRSGAAQPQVNAAGDIVTPRKSIRVVFPSNWAKKDISTIPLFSSTASSDTARRRNCPAICHLSIESAPILRERVEHMHSIILPSTSSYSNILITDRNIHDGEEFECTIHTSDKTARDILISLGAGYPQEERRNVMYITGILRGSSLQESEESGLVPGDLVSVVELGAHVTDVNVLLVHRMKRTRRQPSQMLMVRNSHGLFPTISVRCLRITTRRSHTNCRDMHLSPQHTPAYGKLEDGRFYSVYRVILFSDDFQQFVQKKGSAGGCYLLPINLPLHQRRGRGAVRVISLTPPGISTNKAILSIIPDIIASTTTGIDAVDCQGTKRTVFIEIVGYIGDYVAVQHIKDLTGPRGLAPCPLCTFPKGSVVGATTSEYAYTVSAHSAHASFRRDKNRMRVARSACANDAELQQLGLRRTEGRGSDILHLHALSDALEKARDQVPRTEHGKPVVSATFDPYLSSLVAPDHLFAGLCQDVINANMRLISRSKRIIAESLMKHALSSNGLETEPHLYNHDKLQLHAMSISMMFNLILVAPWAIASSCSYDANGNKNSSSADFHITDCMHLLFKFQMLVSDTLFSQNVI